MKKKKILVIITIIVLIIILCCGLGYTFFMTDLFKSNKDLFSSYIIQNKDLLSILKDDDLITYGKKQEKNSYTYEGTVTTDCSFLEENEQLENSIQNSSITFNGVCDGNNEYKYENFKINYSNKENLQFELIENGDTYAIKIKDVLPKFLGIENNNLKELAVKLGIIDEKTIENVPDKIVVTETKNERIFTEEEEKKLITKYYKIILDSFDEKMFSKEKEEDYVTYVLSTDINQITEVGKNVFSAALEDELIISRLKKYLTEYKNMKEEEIDK